MTKVTDLQFIDSTAGHVATELARPGIAPDRHLPITGFVEATPHPVVRLHAS